MSLLKSAITNISHNFSEPITFNTGVWFNEFTTDLTMSGIINGYEE